MKPTISIVMPSYNNEAYLAETIDSILRQDYKKWELIIIDDGSTDGSKYLYRYFENKDDRIKVVYNEHQGISHARNTGIELAQGEFIAVMDSDDLMNPKRLRMSLNAIKDVDFVYGPYGLANEKGEVQQWVNPGKRMTVDNFKQNNAWPHVTIMARKDCFFSHPYRDEFTANDDAWLVWKWFRTGYKAKRINEPLVIVRVHEASTSRTKLKEIARVNEIVQEEIKQYENLYKGL